MQKYAAYLDNAAATPVCTQALAAFSAASGVFGNPSSLHAAGHEAECILNDSRIKIAHSIGADPGEIVFTPSGTFADNLAVLGTTRRKPGAHIVTSSAEHAAVLNAVRHLEKDMGCKVTYVDPRKGGCIDPADIAAALRPDTVLVSIMLVNNETGAVNPVEDIKTAMDACKSKAMLHTDAVQAHTKIGTDVKTLGVDLMTLSAHKVHGHRGIGALYIKRGARISPIFFGGGQEQGFVPGTESPALAASFAAAVGAAKVHDFSKTAALAGKARDRVSQEIDGAVIISPCCDAGIFMFSLPGLRGETVVHYLAARGVYVSSGSACGRGKRSHVTMALGLDTVTAEGAVRVSLSRFNTEKDIELLVNGIKDAASEIAR